VHQIEVFPAKTMTRAGGEIGERHFVVAAHFRLHVVDFAGESVRRKPFRHGVGVEERFVDFLRRSADDAMKPDSVRGHEDYSFRLLVRANDE
jgi:hypothetical protein